MYELNKKDCFQSLFTPYALHDLGISFHFWRVGSDFPPQSNYSIHDYELLYKFLRTLDVQAD